MLAIGETVCYDYLLVRARGLGQAVRNFGKSYEVSTVSNKDKANKGTAPDTATGPNHELVYRRDHPGNRCSYGIGGNAGIVVFDKGLFAGGLEPGFVPPPTITVSCDLAPIKADQKEAREAAKAAKVIEKAAKAQEKVEVAAAKAVAKQEKADAVLAAAKAKVDAAAAAKGSGASA